MEDVHLVLAIIFVLVLVLIFLYSVGRILSIWLWSTNWFSSSREEKVNLTRSEGHYNANGYLVPDETAVDISLCHSGSFKRFETVDHEFTMEMTDFTSLPTQQQPPGQKHWYPQGFEIPFRQDEKPFDLFDDPQPSCSGYSNDDYFNGDCSDSDYFGTKVPATVFVSLSPIPSPSHVESGPCPDFVVFENETSRKGKGKVPPPRPPPPVFDRIVPPPIPPRVVPPPVPPRRTPIQPTVDREDVMARIHGLLRGVSFESLSSDTSVVMSDLDRPNVTGYLCVGIDFANDATEMRVIIWEARDLYGLNHNIKNTFTRVSFFPDPNSSAQTKICRNASTSSYNEKFYFRIPPHEYHQRSLNFYVYTAGTEECVLIGEGELRLSDIPMKQAVTTWITLSDTGQFRTEWGEIMLSLTYLPTAERLTVVVMRAQHLAFPDNREFGDPFVKVYLLKRGKKLFKKKTTTKRNEKNPIYNEAMIFNVPASMLETLEVRVTVAEGNEDPRPYALGHVFIGAQGIGKSLTHWSQMRNNPRRPISMWHFLGK